MPGYSKLSVNSTATSVVSSSGTATLSYTTKQKGSLLVVYAVNDNATGPPTCTTTGLTWTQVAYADVASTCCCAMFTAISPAASTTLSIAVTITGSAAKTGAWVEEWTGNPASSSSTSLIESVTTWTGTGATGTGSTPSTNNLMSNELALMMVATSGAMSIGNVTGTAFITWGTNQAAGVGGGGFNVSYGLSGYFIQKTPNSPNNPNFGWVTSLSYAAATVIFRPNLEPSSFIRILR